MIRLLDPDALGLNWNAPAVVAGGRIWGLVPKEKLPTYNVFYEARTFSRGAPGLALEAGGVPLGDYLFEFDFGLMAAEVYTGVSYGGYVHQGTARMPARPFFTWQLEDFGGMAMYDGSEFFVLASNKENQYLHSRNEELGDEIGDVRVEGGYSPSVIEVPRPARWRSA